MFICFVFLLHACLDLSFSVLADIFSTLGDLHPGPSTSLPDVLALGHMECLGSCQFTFSGGVFDPDLLKDLLSSLHDAIDSMPFENESRHTDGQGVPCSNNMNHNVFFTSDRSLDGEHHSPPVRTLPSLFYFFISFIFFLLLTMSQYQATFRNLPSN